MMGGALLVTYTITLLLLLLSSLIVVWVWWRLRGGHLWSWHASGFGLFSLGSLLLVKGSNLEGAVRRVISTSEAILPHWDLSRKGPLPDYLYRILRQASFSIMVCGFAWRWDRSRGRLSIHCDHLSIVLAPHFTTAILERVKKGGPSRIMILLVRRLVPLVKWLLDLLGRFLLVRLDRLDLVLSAFPKERSDPDFWCAIHVGIDGCGVLEDSMRSDRGQDEYSFLKMDRVQSHECFLQDDLQQVVQTRRILHMAPFWLHAPLLGAERNNGMSGGGEGRLNIGSVHVDLWPTTLLLLTTTIVQGERISFDQWEEKDKEAPPRQASPQQASTVLPPEQTSFKECPTQSPTQPPTILPLEKLLEIIFPTKQFFTLLCKEIYLAIHLPISQPELLRFEAMTVTIDDFRAYGQLDPKTPFAPLLLLQGGRARLGAKAAEHFGAKINPPINRLFADALGSAEGGDESLLCLERVVLCNAWPADQFRDVQVLEDRMVREWITLLQRGRPAWQIDAQQSPTEMEQLLRTPKGVSVLDYNALAVLRQPLMTLHFKPLDRMVVLRAGKVDFDVPFEYPLNNLFDHLAFFIKTVQAPLPHPSDRQDFDPFSHTWRLIAMADMAGFSIGDDPFEVRLQRCLRAKHRLYPKLARLDRLFWLQCKMRERLQKTRDTWMDSSLKALVGASEEPETLQSNPFFVNQYVKLQEKSFSLYLEHFDGTEGRRKGKESKMGEMEETRQMREMRETREMQKANETKETNTNAKNTAPANTTTTTETTSRPSLSSSSSTIEQPLFQVTACHVNFSVQWSPSYLEGFDLAGLLNAIEQERSLRQEDVAEFGLSLGGFLDVSAEELTVSIRDYPLPLAYACQARLLGLLFMIEEPNYAASKAHHLIRLVEEKALWGLWNLLNLDRTCSVHVQRSILPIKLYHSLQLSVFGERPVLSGFSPLYEGTFQMMERAFELFSKPNEEPSPYLPFWDKLRLIFRGTSSCIAVRSPCNLICLAGTDLYSTEESLSLFFPDGFTVGLLDSQIKLRVPRAVTFFNSQSESILQFFHRTVCGGAFYRSDCHLGSVHAIGKMPLISFPSVTFTISFEMVGREGKRPIPHSDVKICAVDNLQKNGNHRDPSSANGNQYDSYRDFRVHGLHVKIQIDAANQQDNIPSTQHNQLVVFYYRQLEEWGIRHFGRYVQAPIKPGALFQFGTLSKTAVPKISTVLMGIQFQLSFDGLFGVRALHYEGPGSFGGLLLCSSGRTKLWMFWRRSNFRSPENRNYGRWFMHFGEIDFSSMGLYVLVPAGEEEEEEKGPPTTETTKKMEGERGAKRRLEKKTMIKKDANADLTEPALSFNLDRAPIQYEGVAMLSILSAPRLFYLAINETCFKHDPEASALHRTSIEGRLRGLEREIDLTAASLRSCDPLSSMDEFMGVKRELGVLLEQQDCIKQCLQGEAPPHKLLSNHRLLIHNAQLQWHQRVRDAVFALVDQQLQQFRCTLGVRYQVLRTIQSIQYDQLVPALTSPVSAIPLSATDASRLFFETLIQQHQASPIDAGPECGMGAAEDVLFGQMCDPEDLRDFGMHVPLKIDVKFVHPQIAMLDTTTAIPHTAPKTASVIIAAHSATLQYATALQEEYGERVGRRTKIVLEDAQLYIALKDDFENKDWPPFYPTEYLLTEATEANRFQRISEKTRACFVYDVSNKHFRYSTSTSPIRRVFGEGDFIRVDANAISLLTNSLHYCVIYDIIVNLLVYRDPTLKLRHDQLEALVLATNIFDKAQVARTVEQMQKTLRLQIQSLTAELARYIEQEDKQMDGYSSAKRKHSLKKGKDHRSISEEEEFVMIHMDDKESRLHQLERRYARVKMAWDGLGLVVDAMRTFKANTERLRQRQTRLLLDVKLGRIQWTLLKDDQAVLCELGLHGIHERWLSSEDASQSNLVEIRMITGINRLPKAFYRTIIAPIQTEIMTRMSINLRGIGTQNNTVRFFFKALPPIGGIRIIEHAELNLAPLHIQLTFDIAEELFKFFFPSSTTKQANSKSNSQQKASTGHARSSQAGGLVEKAMDANLTGLHASLSGFVTNLRGKVDNEVVEMMKARANENCSFIYVTVPASQHCISYKGRGETSITDIEEFILKLPDFEYHSQIWSWLEFALQLQRDSIRVLLSNIGSLVRDKLRRLGTPNQPEFENVDFDSFSQIEALESRVMPPSIARTTTGLKIESAGTASPLSISSASTALRHIPKPPSSQDSQEERERKAKMLLGKTYKK